MYFHTQWVCQGKESSWLSEMGLCEVSLLCLGGGGAGVFSFCFNPRLIYLFKYILKVSVLSAEDIKLNTTLKDLNVWIRGTDRPNTPGTCPQLEVWKSILETKRRRVPSARSGRAWFGQMFQKRDAAEPSPVWQMWGWGRWYKALSGKHSFLGKLQGGWTGTSAMEPDSNVPGCFSINKYAHYKRRCGVC